MNSFNNKENKKNEVYLGDKQIITKDYNKITFIFNYDKFYGRINDFSNNNNAFPLQIVKLKESLSKNKSPNTSRLGKDFFNIYGSLKCFLNNSPFLFPDLIKDELKKCEKIVKVLNLKKSENEYIIHYLYHNFKDLRGNNDCTNIIIIKIEYPKEDELVYQNIKRKKIKHSSFISYIILYNTFIIIIIIQKIGAFYKKLNYHILLDKISNIIKKIIYFSYISSIKTNYFQNKKNLILYVKSLEYKEFFARMIEKINKIDNIKIKAEAIEALSTANQEVNLYKRHKQVSILKKLFLIKMDKFTLIGKEIIEYANKYNVLYYYSCKVSYGVYDQTIYESFLKERNIPKYIQIFGPKEPHMIPVSQYLDVRLSRTIRALISKVNEQGRNTEIFIGSEEKMMVFYTNFGYERIANLKTNSSLKYYLFANIENPKLNKIVILGVGNETKLNHLLLQLKYSDVDLDKIIIRGNLEDSILENKRKLDSIIDGIKLEIDTVFMGNRSLILIEFANRKYPNEMRTASNVDDAEKIAEKLLKEHHNLKTYEIGDGIYKFSCFELRIMTKIVAIIGFRMPNGNLAQIATEAFMKKGVHHFVMLGAGGSLSSLSSVGSYQLINSTTYNNSHILLSDINIKKMNVDLSDIPLVDNGNNITLNSPLEETRNWMTKVRNSNLTSVDVETYHIIKGIRNCENYMDKTEVLLGIFISDVVGAHPLVQKIKSYKAWEYLPKLLNKCFEYIENKIQETLVNQDSYFIFQSKKVVGLGRKIRYNTL